MVEQYAAGVDRLLAMCIAFGPDDLQSTLDDLASSLLEPTRADPIGGNVAGQGHSTAAALHSPGADGSPAPGVGDVRGPSVGRVGTVSTHPGVHRSPAPRCAPVWSPRILCAGGRTFCTRTNDDFDVVDLGARSGIGQPCRGSAVRCAAVCRRGPSRSPRRPRPAVIPSWTRRSSSGCTARGTRSTPPRRRSSSPTSRDRGGWWGGPSRPSPESTTSTTTWTWRSSSTTCLPCSTWWETGTTCGA